jgi:hypothetical protein
MVFFKMPGDIVMTNDQEEGKSQINKIESSDINRGFELMLRHRSRREKAPEPRTFGIMFGKVISLLKREIHFRFEISLGIINKL